MNTLTDCAVDEHTPAERQASRRQMFLLLFGELSLLNDLARNFLEVPSAALASLSIPESLLEKFRGESFRPNSS